MNLPRTLFGVLLAAVFVLTAGAQERPSKPLRIIAFGAHPDDAEFQIGGTAAKWAEAGHKVKLVSMTNGDIGHWRMAGGPLAQRRTAEDMVGGFFADHDCRSIGVARDNGRHD